MNKHLLEKFSPIATWWAFVSAEYFLVENKIIDDDVVVLSFMGSGASTNVTAKQLNEFCEALEKLRHKP
jgi:hypothetical protein